jgi:hypothetical protein
VREGESGEEFVGVSRAGKRVRWSGTRERLSSCGRRAVKKERRRR